ncbi:MAG: glycoside hydrolase family 95 protein [Eubacterium sp.]|nr:glycoside hydrolase family 95 protein [Eubacterium sp.]
MKNQLFYTKKAKAFEEALPVGNGRLGAMVFGNLKNERIALNEDTLWSGYPHDQNKKDAYRFLPALREAILSGDHAAAARISNEDMHGAWSECYLPFGDLIIAYKGTTGHGYRRTLDLEKGVATAQNTAVTETVFVSHPAQLIAVNIRSVEGVSFTVRLDSQLQHRTYTEEDCLLMEGRAPEVCYPVYYHAPEPVRYGDKGMPFCGAVKVLGDAVFEKDCITVKNATDTTLLISLATGFMDFQSMPNANAKQRALQYFENSRFYPALYKAHTADVAALFDRVTVDFGTERADLPTDKRLKRFQTHSAEDANLAALLFQYGRYLTIACSRPGTQAMNLQGIFNEHLRAPWSSNYTTNINTQMNYWCTDICNLSECFAPLEALVTDIVANGRQAAQDYYGCRGSCAHHNSDIWAMARPAGDPLGKAEADGYAPWPSALPWLLNQVAEHYRYTEEAMSETTVRCFAEVLAFYQDFLTAHDGRLVTCPSLSPENTYLDGGVKAHLTALPTMDIGLLQEFFANCAALGMTPPDFDDTIPIGADGRIQEWAAAYEEAEPEHRHVSHLYCVYPSAVPQSEAIKKACARSLYARGFGGTGWSLGWKVCLWARLGHAENAFRLIKNQLVPINPNRLTDYSHGGSYPNLFDAHPPFQIDGNFGVAAGIAELFKNKTVPKEWNGYVKGLRLHGGKTLNLRFENGVAEEF